ncbi:DUF1194 domain-containing protein [Aliiroseovarius subalbicans]|uniref:DUF1194 domain-containing protein n=1 Tax=Aliiroseovarius subalbicans TaxID=2925840 RepID=UPI001F57D0B1|nr:DUF1194 domain-containing protein [Aliiroseovarius subalbicans]MCI2397872.1 DUF1194 domain-containing protein [Aliiroseovarius subalbicans]
MGQHGKYRALVGAAALALTCGVVGAALADPCRQALALGLDVSGSVNEREYRLQLDGLAAALDHPDVASAILAMPGTPVRVMVFEWSGPRDQRLLLDWTPVPDSATLAQLTATLRGTTRTPANPSTALGTAIIWGAQKLAQQPDCWKRTLDISGDGKSNTGPRPQDVADQPVLAGITVNALVIGSDTPGGGVRTGEIGDLETYFRSLVIRGPAAFVEVAEDFADYQAAMIRKLLREVEGMALSQTLPDAQ